MPKATSLVFIPGSWHKPNCYDKLIGPLRDDHHTQCIAVALPSSQDNPQATFKDDVDAARNAIISEMSQGRDVVVIAHSYGGMIGNSSIKGLTRPQGNSNASKHEERTGYVVALVLIASGFTITGFAFMDIFCGLPLPWFKADKESGYAVLKVDPRQFFYHDVPEEEAKYWVSQLTTQSVAALYEGGEHAYAGWQDVPVWYIGTIEDMGLPVAAQRIGVAAARAAGATIHHTELQSSHSPFLSTPKEVVKIILDAVRTVSETQVNEVDGGVRQTEGDTRVFKEPRARLTAPSTWVKYGLPFCVGRVVGWSVVGFMALRRLWRTK